MNEHVRLGYYRARTRPRVVQFPVTKPAQTSGRSFRNCWLIAGLLSLLFVAAAP